jgi:phosphoribosylformylglycinamidine synthase
VIVLFGENTDELGGSEYLKAIHDLVAGDAPALDLAGERALQQALLEAIRSGLVKSAHDCAEGGLAVALAESAIADAEHVMGVDVELDDELPTAALLFGEAQGRAVVSCAPEQLDALLAVAAKHGVPARQIGTVGAEGGEFHVRTREATIFTPAAQLARLWYDAIPRRMGGTPADVETSLESIVQTP